MIMKGISQLYVAYFSLLLLGLSNISLATIANDSSNACANYFRQFSLSKIQDYLSTLMNSGHYLFDLGNYETCISTNDTNYFLINLIISEPTKVPLSLGLCLPSACNLTDAQTYLNSQLTYISTILSQLNITTPIKSIILIDPNDIPYENDSWLYTTIVIISILIILCILATIKYQYTKLKNENNSNERGIENSSFDNSKHDMKNDVSMFDRVLDCFEISKNFQKLFNTKIPEEHDKNLGVLNGIRTLSFFYVVYGHECIFRGMIGTNLFQFLQMRNEKWVIFAISGLYAVDIFLFISGFLVSFVLLNKLKKIVPSFKNYLSIILHRYLRIMPLYFVCILIYWKLSVYVGSGPLWFSYVELANQSCDTGWWYHLFFGDNIFYVFTKNSSEYCFGLGWYLAVDFQLYIFAPFLLWYYIFDQKKGKFCIAFVTLGFLIGSIILSIVDKIAMFPVLESSNNPDFIYWYFTPYARGSPYYYGLFLGILYKEWKNPEQRGRFINLILNNRLFRVLISLFGIGIMMFVMWIPLPLLDNPNAWPHGLQYFFMGIEKPLFVIGVSLFIMPCLLGKNRLFFSMLNNTFFFILAKMSYCGYLIHLTILWIGAFSSKQTYNVNKSMILYDLIDTIVLTLLVSIVLILIVEIPFVNLEKIFMTTHTNRIEERKRHLLSANEIESETKQESLKIAQKKSKIRIQAALDIHLEIESV